MYVLSVPLQHLQDLKNHNILIEHVLLLDYKSYIGDAILSSLHLQWEATCSFSIWITIETTISSRFWKFI